MGFWIFMTVCNLLIPILMIGIGKVFVKYPPKTINGIYGYRTSMSMKNTDTWNFAHLYCGKLWWKIGWIMLPVSMIAMIMLVGKNEDTVGIWGAVIVTIQCIILIAAIFPVESALKKNFDKSGKKINLF